MANGPRDHNRVGVRLRLFIFRLVFRTEIHGEQKTATLTAHHQSL